jgi:hypothetical protein
MAGKFLHHFISSVIIIISFIECNIISVVDMVSLSRKRAAASRDVTV